MPRAARSTSMPWERTTRGYRCRAAAIWLKEQGRSFSKVYECDEYAVYYESLEGEARHQRWRPDQKDLSKLELEGPHRAGWPVIA
jgi:hypothetical protein